MKVKYCIGFAFSSDKSKVLLIKKTKPKWQAGFLNGIGGKIEQSDLSVFDSMTREFREETGLETNNDDWRFFGKLHSESFELNCFAGFFNCQFLEKYQTTTEEEVVIADINDLFNRKFDNCVPNTGWLISLCLDNDFSYMFIEGKLV